MYLNKVELYRNRNINLYNDVYSCIYLFVFYLTTSLVASTTASSDITIVNYELEMEWKTTVT